MPDAALDPASLEVPVGGVLVVWSPALRYGIACARSTAVERARADRLLRTEDRARSLTAWSLLRQVAGATLGLDPREVVVAHTPGGRPTIPTTSVEGLRVEVSVTHAGAVVGVACAFGWRVGLDVEPRESFASERAAGVLAAAATTSEHAWLRAQPLHAAAVGRLWVRKEAVLKAAGKGLSVDPRTVVLDRDGSRVVAWPFAEPADSATIVDVDPGPDHLGAIALLGLGTPSDGGALGRERAPAVRVVRLPGLP